MMDPGNRGGAGSARMCAVLSPSPSPTTAAIIVRESLRRLAISRSFVVTLRSLGAELSGSLPLLAAGDLVWILGEVRGTFERICLLGVYIEVANRTRDLGVELWTQFLSEHLVDADCSVAALEAYAEGAPLFSGEYDRIDAVVAQRHRDQLLRVVTDHYPALLNISRGTLRGLGLILTERVESVLHVLADEQAGSGSATSTGATSPEHQARTAFRDGLVPGFFAEVPEENPRIATLRSWVRSSTGAPFEDGTSDLDVAAGLHERGLGIRDLLHASAPSADEALALTTLDDTSLFERCFAVRVERGERRLAWELLQRFRARVALREAGAVGDAHVSFDQVRDVLARAGHPAVLVEFVRNGTSWYVLLTRVGASEPEALRVDVGSDVEESIRELFLGVSRFRPGRFQSGVLKGDEHVLLARLSPLVAWLPTAVPSGTHLCVASYGVLHAVPLQIVPFGSSGECVLDRYTVSHVPAAGYLPLCCRRPRVPPDPVGLIAGAEYADRVALLTRHLDAVERALRERGIDTRRFERSADTEELLACMKAAPAWRFIYLHGHGRFVAAAPEQSGVSIGASPGASLVYLTAEQLGGSGLAADLVIASFCVSGRSILSPGEETLGIVRRLLASDIASVVSALWGFPAEAGRRLIEDVIQRWVAGQSKATALAGAQRAVRSGSLGARWAHPYYWGAFQLSGDWR